MSTVSRRIVDLRSDTVTQPTKPMLEAMITAKLGDDVLGDDPTVHLLEEKIASLFGKEHALFMPSGTMANQVAIRSHTEAGDEIIMEATGHTFLYETGAMAGLCGVQANLILGARGIIDAKAIKERIRPNQTYVPQTKLVILENTHNHGGGTIYPIENIQTISELCQNEGIALHLDGARLWNAMVETGISTQTYGSYFDSISVCLSKGLGAPIGSVIAGKRKWIERAKRFRKMFGGGMRQAGLLAAAGLYALDHNINRLKEDHRRARTLAKKLSKMPFIEINPNDVETNIFFFGVKHITGLELSQRLKQSGIWLIPLKERMVRAVTHMGVTDEDIDHVVSCMRNFAP